MTSESSHILVIDDNSDLLEGITGILDFCGYPSEGITRYSERVFERLKAGHYGLIILDVMLDGTDGRDLARKFKTAEETRQVPILMISAYHHVEDSVKQAGADAFLQKPFGLEELRQKVETLLENHA